MLKSLIWKNRNETTVIDEKNYKEVADNLNLSKVLILMSREPDIKITPEVFLSSITADIENIRYRQCIMSEFLKIDNIQNTIAEVLENLDKMVDLHKTLKPDLRIPAAMLRLKKLESYVSIMSKLEKLFMIGSSDDFREIGEALSEYNKKNKMNVIIEDIREIKRICNDIKSLSIGVNLDSNFKAMESVIVSVNDYKYDKSSIIEKMNCADDEMRSRLAITSEADIRSTGRIYSFSNSIYKEYESLLNREMHEIEKRLEKHKDIVTSSILSYTDELKLYYGAVRLCRYLEKHKLDYCLPGICADGRILKSMYSLNMVYESAANGQQDMFRVVSNDIKINPDKNMVVITGANDGGKTILLESIGVIQLLFQNGLPVPASKGEMSVYNSFHTHFPKDEDISKGAGRLGEEAERISGILRKTKKGSLVLLNDPYITTSPVEGQDILILTMEKFMQKGVGIYLVTHYLDVIDGMADKESTAGLHMETKNGLRTYKVVEGEESGGNHALDIARSFGVDAEGILNLINVYSKAEEVCK